MPMKQSSCGSTNCNIGDSPRLESYWFIACLSQRRRIELFEQPALVCPAYAHKQSSIAVMFAIVVLPSHKLGAPCEAARAVAPTGIDGIPPQAPLEAGEQHVLYDSCNDVLIFLNVNQDSLLADRIAVF